MKAGYIIALTLALVASLPAHASQRDTGAEVHAAEQPRAEKIEITTVENRILVSNAPVGSLYQQALFSIGLVLFLFIMLINVFLNVFIKKRKED